MLCYCALLLVLLQGLSTEVLVLSYPGVLGEQVSRAEARRRRGEEGHGGEGRGAGAGS